MGVNDIGSDGAAALASENGLGALPRLTSLNLIANWFGAAGAAALAAARAEAGLEDWDREAWAPVVLVPLVARLETANPMPAATL